MPLISSSIPNLINGVSQQPPALRLASQAEAVVNCLPSPVEGLKKRPPLHHVAKLFNGSAGSKRPFIQLVERDGGISYIIIIQDGAIKVVDLPSGTLFTPTGNATDFNYLDVAGVPSERFRIASIADYTFIVNREKKVQMSDALSPVWGTTTSEPSSMIFIKAANYDTEYSVTLGGVTKTYRTDPAGGHDLEGTFSQSANSSTVSVSINSHGLIAGDKLQISFKDPASEAVAGTYTVTGVGSGGNDFTYTAASQNNSSVNSGNCTVTTMKKLSTIDIADKLADQLDTISGYSVNNDDYIIKIIKNDLADYDVSSKDTGSGDGTKTIKTIVDDLNDLPVKAYEGFIVKVQGSQASEYDDYYVRFTLNKANQTIGTYGDGVWKETVAPGIKYRFDETTMPHVLIRNVATDGTVSFQFQRYLSEQSNGTYVQSGTAVTVSKTAHGLSNGEELFILPTSGSGVPITTKITVTSTSVNTFSYTATNSGSFSGNVSYGYTWSGRIAGDEKTALEPSFVGTYIENLNFFRNRLVLLADESAILSAAGADYGRFFPETVQTLIDSDPVDLSCGGTSINLLVSSVAFANTLLLFSRHSQFRLDSGTNVGSAISPKTAGIAQMTNFEMDTSVDPIAVGRNTYFPIPKGNFSGVREFFLPDSSGSVPLSEDVTASIPRFIPSNLCSFTSCVAEDAMVVISKDQPRRIYLYKFFFEEDTKLQSAWSYWEAEGSKSILGAGIKGSDLFAIVEYSDAVYLEKVSLRPEQVDPGTEIEILLDRKTTEPVSDGAYSQSGTTVTVVSVNHGYSTNDSIYVSLTSGDGIDGQYTITSTSGANTFTYTAGTSLTTSGNCSFTKYLTLNNPGALGVQTVITLPYPIAAEAQMVVVGRFEEGNNLLRHGQVIEPLSQTSNSITVPGDLRTAIGNKVPRFFVGERYTMTYEFSTPYIKEQPPGGGVALAAGPKLQMRTWTVIFDESSAFELKVTPASRDTNTYPYNGIIVGEAPPAIGAPSVLTGSFRVPVMASNIDTKIEISSTSPLPCRFQSAEWEGFYHTRAKRQ